MTNKNSSKNSYSVPALEKATLILEYITHSSKGYNLRDIHSALGIAKTTTFSILTTLVNCGYIRKTPEGLYIPTLKLTSLGIRAREFAYDTHFLLPRLESLRDRTGFTVFFCMYDNGEQVVLEKLDGLGSMVQFKAFIGQRKKLNTSSGGKAIAAHLSPRELQIVLDKGLDNPTVNSIYKEDEFLAHLEEIRQRKYAIDDNEGELGVRCIGAPIFMYGGSLFGAVSVTTLNENLPMTEIPGYAEILLEVTAQISANLGYKKT